MYRTSHIALRLSSSLRRRYLSSTAFHLRPLSVTKAFLARSLFSFFGHSSYSYQASSIVTCGGWVRGWHLLVDRLSVLYSGIVIACFIALFNFFGLSVTKYVSATARSLALGWVERSCDQSHSFRVAGFGLLVYGTVARHRSFYLSLRTKTLTLNLVLVQQPSSVTAISANAGVEYEYVTLHSADALDETARLPADLGASKLYATLFPHRRKVLVVIGVDSCFSQFIFN